MLIGETAPHRITPFCEIVSHFRGDEILVVNDTRVVPARVKGKKEPGAPWNCSLWSPRWWSN